MDLQLLETSIRKSEHQKHGVQVYKTSDSDLEVALNNDKIIHVALERLKEVLRYAMLKIGLRAANIPTNEEKHILITHILTNYANHTCEEIKLAFDMAIAVKLDVEVNCYENFSCLYFSNIMNAYRSWARQEVMQIKKPVEQRIYSEEEILNERRGQIETAYQAMRKGIYPLLHKYFLEVLQGDGLINEGETIEEFFVSKLGSNAENIYRK